MQRSLQHSSQPKAISAITGGSRCSGLVSRSFSERVRQRGQKEESTLARNRTTYKRVQTGNLTGRKIIQSLLARLEDSLNGNKTFIDGKRSVISFAATVLLLTGAYSVLFRLTGDGRLTCVPAGDGRVI